MTTDIPADEERETATTEETEVKTEVVEEVAEVVEKTEDEIKSEEIETAKQAKRDKTQRRINKLTRERKEAQTETAKLREELAKYQKPVEPDADDYESQDDYVKARVAYEVKQLTSDTTEQPSASTQSDLQSTFVDGIEKYQDFEEVVKADGIPFSEPVVEMITEGENSADIMYHLAKNPVELERIGLLDANSMARELGRLEARLSIPKPRTTKTPEPVVPIDGGGSAEPDYSNESMAEYADRRNKKQFG